MNIIIIWIMINILITTYYIISNQKICNDVIVKYTEKYILFQVIKTRGTDKVKPKN